MAKKRAPTGAKRRAAAKAPPLQTMSETIIDFGGPLISRIVPRAPVG